MSALIRNSIVAVLMLITSGIALALKPTERIADEGPPLNLENIIPKKFGDWQEEPLRMSQIVNPQQKKVLDEIYTQILSRTYINNKGERIMLSIAYGADQSDAKQLHYPEVCYPAQGFQITSSKHDEVITSVGNVRVKRMMAILGDRTEPVTYWSTVGNKIVVGGKETKLEQLRYGFKGKIPDGLLFRVSSINNDAEQGYMLQDDFLNQIVTSIPINNRLRIAGI